MPRIIVFRFPKLDARMHVSPASFCGDGPNPQQYLVDLHVVSVEEHGPDVIGAERAALVHPSALTPCAGLAEMCQLHHLFGGETKEKGG